MELKIDIRMDNASFEENRPEEIKRVLLQMLNCINIGDTIGKLKDTHGNLCGEWRIKE